MTTIKPTFISKDFDNLYIAAKEVRLKAHAPYSKLLELVENFVNDKYSTKFWFMSFS